MPTISVIVPVYKVEPYLRQCVDSILGQTFRDFELILVDDGSPDSCPAICDEYAQADRRVHVIHKQNGGLSSARNAGLDVAKGEYIAFVDSDDWICEDTLQVLLTKQRETNAHLVLCNIVPFYPPEYDGSRRKNSMLSKGLLSQNELVDRLAQSDNWGYVVAWNKLYRKEIWEDLRFPEGYIHEDEAVIHRVIGKCEKIAVTPEPLYFYRQISGGITSHGIRIQTTDKLTAYADRISYSAEKAWVSLEKCAIGGFIHAFLKLYFRFERIPENEKYFRRMDDSLKKALPYILKSESVSLRHKIYLASIRMNPKIYASLKKLLKG